MVDSTEYRIFHKTPYVVTMTILCEGCVTLLSRLLLRLPQATGPLLWSRSVLCLLRAGDEGRKCKPRAERAVRLSEQEPLTRGRGLGAGAVVLKPRYTPLYVHRSEGRNTVEVKS